jgi:hypothetical protein
MHGSDPSPSDQDHLDFDSDEEPKDLERSFELSPGGCSFLEAAPSKRKRGRKPDEGYLN